MKILKLHQQDLSLSSILPKFLEKNLSFVIWWQSQVSVCCSGVHYTNFTSVLLHLNNILLYLTHFRDILGINSFTSQEKSCVSRYKHLVGTAKVYFWLKTFAKYLQKKLEVCGHIGLTKVQYHLGLEALDKNYKTKCQACTKILLSSIGHQVVEDLLWNFCLLWFSWN